MSQNILLIIREDIRALSEKVDGLQTAVDDIRVNIPDVTELNVKLDAQTAALEALSVIVNGINDTLNPDLPEIPVFSTSTHPKSFAKIKK